MTAYLERFGGYKNARDAGLSLWVAAHAMDCAAEGDFAGTREYLALLCTALEQSALDGSWSLGRSAGDAVCRSDATCCGSWQTICTFGPSELGSYIPGLPSGDRDPGHPKDRGQKCKTWKPEDHKGGARGRQGCVTKTTPKISQEAKTGCSCIGATTMHAVSSCTVPDLSGGGGEDLPTGSRGVATTFGSPTSERNGKSTTNPGKQPACGPQLSYPKWCATLVGNVLKTRTPFASYLRTSISLSQAMSRTGLSPTFFPIPVPYGALFDRMPAPSSRYPYFLYGPQLLVQWWEVWRC